MEADDNNGWILGEDGEWYEEVEEWEEYEEELEEMVEEQAVPFSVPQNPLPPTMMVAPQWMPPQPSPMVQPVMAPFNPQPVAKNAGEALVPAQTAEEAAAMGRMLDRTYKFEDYEPRRDGWLADVSTEIFVSMFFKAYFGFFLFTSGAMLALLFVNWICTTVYYIFAPPGDNAPYIQSVGILVAFFYLSFAMVAAICMWFDVLKIFFSHSRTDSDLWGISHARFSKFAKLCCCGMCEEGDEREARKERQKVAHEAKKEPSPWLLHLGLIVLALPFPILFSLISTVSQKKSVIYFAQQLFYVTTITTSAVLAAIYIWFHIRAYFMKKHAFERRGNDDLLKAIVDKDGKEKKRKNNWYRSQIILEEFGLDIRTLRWSIVAIPVGLTPIFSINVAMALDGVESNNNAGWVATVLVMCCGLLLIQQITEAKRSHRVVFVTITFLIIFSILGIVGCAVTGSPAAIAVVVVPLVACQGTLIRKRDHTLTRKEICELFGISLERSEAEGMQSTRWDTFLCSGRNTLFAILECLDIHTIFGYRHPKVVEMERRLRRQRVCLRSDFKVLMGFWGIIGVFYFFVILIGQASVEKNDGMISAVGTGSETPGVSPSGICSIPIAPVDGFRKSLNIVDMAMFAALSNSFGTDHDIDFATWFSDTPSIKRLYPTGNFLSEAGLAWEHVADATTGSHIITVRASNRGYFWAQHIFTWGDALAFQVASTIAPQLITWDLSDRQNFVKGMGSLKQGFATDWLPTRDLEAYVADVVSGLKPNATIILVGTGFGGGYAKIVAGRLNITYVTFNAPGVELSWKNFEVNGFSSKSIDVVSQDSLISSVDLQTKSNLLYTLPCHEDSAHRCSGILQVLATLLVQCGDSQGRKSLMLS